MTRGEKEDSTTEISYTRWENACTLRLARSCAQPAACPPAPSPPTCAATPLAHGRYRRAHQGRSSSAALLLLHSPCPVLIPALCALRVPCSPCFLVAAHGARIRLRTRRGTPVDHIRWTFFFASARFSFSSFSKGSIVHLSFRFVSFCKANVLYTLHRRHQIFFLLNFNFHGQFTACLEPHGPAERKDEGKTGRKLQELVGYCI